MVNCQITLRISYELRNGKYTGGFTFRIKFCQLVSNRTVGSTSSLNVPLEIRRVIIKVLLRGIRQHEISVWPKKMNGDQVSHRKKSSVNAAIFWALCKYAHFSSVVTVCFLRGTLCHVTAQSRPLYSSLSSPWIKAAPVPLLKMMQP